MAVTKKEGKRNKEVKEWVRGRNKEVKEWVRGRNKEVMGWVRGRKKDERKWRETGIKNVNKRVEGRKM